MQQLDESNATNTTTQHTYVSGTKDIASQWPNAGGSVTTTTTAYYGGGLAESVNGALSYTLSDGLGSVSESVSAANGTVTATQLYSPYGTVRYQSGTLPTDYAFTHQRADATSGLDYYNARYYDPVAGQFSSPDTTLAGGLNRYAYVAGNPETRTDPSGHLYANPRDWETWKAMEQAQMPAKVYAYQWAAPGTWQGFVSYLGQAVLGTDTLHQSFHTLFQDPQASAGDKWKAAAAVALTLASDALTIGGTFVGDPEVGEAARAAEESLLLADDAAHTAAAATDLSTDLSTDACAGGLSFAADTPVATPQGEQAIASLKVGQPVEAYDPATGKTAPQTIVRVFLNHDHDRLDVTLATPELAATAATAAGAGHGRQAPHAAVGAARATLTRDETIHTMANHPWLTADRGWVVAGQLHDGEPVRLLDGTTARVVALHALPGVGPMWDLSLDSVHTFAVGDLQAVVHNTGCLPSSTTVTSGSDGTTVYSQLENGSTYQSALSANKSNFTMKLAYRDVPEGPHASEVFSDQLRLAGGDPTSLQTLTLENVENEETLQMHANEGTVVGSPLDKMAHYFAADNGIQLGAPYWRGNNIIYNILR